VAESERRLALHVDEAILTLAEALLRRRPRARPTGLAAVLGAAEVASSMPQAEGDDDDDDGDEDVLAEQDVQEEEDDVDEESEPVGLVDEDDEGDDEPKRKPWWKPGG